MNYRECVGETFQSLSEAAGETRDPDAQRMHSAAAQTYATLALAEAIKNGLSEVANAMAR